MFKNMFYNISSVINESLSSDDPLFWSRPSPIDCNVVRLVGIFLCLVAFIGIVLNGALTYSFIRYPRLRTPPNIFIMFISVIGLVASSSIIPLAGSSSVYCRWLYNRIGCQIEAVMAFLYGCASSYLLCAVSLSRCYIIVRPFNAKSVTVAKCTALAVVAVSISFIWTMLPIIGWNEYTLEGALTSCCVNWYDQRFSYVSYNLFLFIFVYCLPLTILVVANGRIYIGLKRMRFKITQGDKMELSQKKIEMEERILKCVIVTVMGFVLTWTPYATVFFISAFRRTNEVVPPLATFVCACFAKSSVTWIPMLYISTSTHFRFTFVDPNSTNRLTAASSITREALQAHAPDKANPMAPVSIIDTPMGHTDRVTTDR